MSRIEQLLDAMTLPEKLGQLTMTACSHTVTGPVIAGDSTASIRDGTIGNLLNLFGAQSVRQMQRLAVEQSRLRIPLLIGFDIIHGHRTLFPIPLAEAGLFDPQAWAHSAREAAREAAADGLAMTFAPMLDISRDPRWGRTAEGPGEDAWLASRIAVAKVRGFQGDDLTAGDALAAVAKHFCAYGSVMAGREYCSVDISERSVRELHLPAFTAAVDAGVAAIMPAFTDLGGIPMTASTAMLRDCLRGELGFEGVLVSDYNAVAELINHGVAADLPEAAALALKAGVDIDMMADAYRKGLPIALQRGLVALPDIDQSVWRVLCLKQRLGLFEDPYRRGAVPESGAAVAERRRLARTLAARAMVLLKNNAGSLPLRGSVRRLALIGPLADAAAEMGGPWSLAGEPEHHVSVLAGLRLGLPGIEILHAPGVTIAGEALTGIAPALELCGAAHAVLLCLGEAANMSGEAASRAEPGLPGQQRRLAEAVLERARACNIPVIALLFCGRPLTIEWLAAQADALIAAWFLGSEAGNAVGDVLSGRVCPSGRTPISWPRSVGQVPIFFGQRPGGRPFEAHNHYTSRYLDMPNEPLYPFGYGLSYARCTLTALQVSPDLLSEADTLCARVRVTNEGECETRETVFLFTHDPVASVARPLLELKGCEQVQLRPGETREIELQLPAGELRFLGADLQPVFEPGEIEILVGPCADRSRLLAARVRLR